MTIDDKIHQVYEYLTGTEIRWNDFRKIGIEEDYNDWYYAEDRLYVLRDRIMGWCKFIEASSPGEALEIMKDEANIFHHADMDSE